MKKSRFTEEQMVTILREADKSPVAEVAKKHGISEQTMLGLRLGLSIDAVRKLIGCDGESCQKVTQFHNSPRLLIDCLRPGVILFRAADMGDVEYDWQECTCPTFLRKIYSKAL